LKNTVKDFAKTLKITESILLERLQNAGLSHKKASDEITTQDKQALLKSLKANKSSVTKSVTSNSGVKVTSKGRSIIDNEGSKSYSDNIEAKRAAASEQLKEQQIKRENQLKEAVKEKAEVKKKTKLNTSTNVKEKIRVKHLNKTEGIFLLRNLLGFVK
jgi:translation initiation factor IF-2